MDNYPLNMDTNLLCPENLDMLYSKMGKLLEEFGEYLTSLRTAAGFSSLDSVAKAAKGAVSKSRLSLYERGEVKTIKPETLRALAKLYGVAYELLAGRWFEAQYQVSPISLSEDSIIKESSVEKCTFRGSKENRGEDFDVISLSQLEFLQTKLPKGSQVGVASIDFLDDTIFFDMVSENINRGVSYRYLMPEDQQAIYMSFLSKLNEKYPKLKGRLDGKLTEFVPRANLDFPVNYILYIYPDGEIK